MKMTISRLESVKEQIQQNRNNANRYRQEHQVKVDEFTRSVHNYDMELADLEISLTLLKAGALVSDETVGAS